MENEDAKKEKIEIITNPDELNDRIKVARTPIWIILFATLVLILGWFVWTIFGTIDDKVECITFVKDYRCVTYILEKDLPRVKPSMSLVINGNEYEITDVSAKTKILDEMYIESDENDKNTGSFSRGDKVYEVIAEGMDKAGYTSGIYKGNIIVGRISPMQFLIN